jgi:hypothetical protein
MPLKSLKVWHPPVYLLIDFSQSTRYSIRTYTVPIIYKRPP